jgi:hypothetical protein
MERQPRRRRRPALSCLECQRRKIKCDRSEPCARCVSVKAQCTYKLYRDEPPKQQQLRERSVDGSVSSPSAYAASTSTQTQQASRNKPHTDFRNLPAAPKVTTAASTAGQNDSPDVPGAGENRPANRSQNGEADVHAMLWQKQTLGKSSASSLVHQLSETGRDILARQAGLQDSQVILNKTRTPRSSHWVGASHEVRSTIPSTS